MSQSRLLSLLASLSVEAAVHMQVKRKKVSPKLAFFCLEASSRSEAALSKFDDPDKVIARGHKTNEFALCFDVKV